MADREESIRHPEAGRDEEAGGGRRRGRRLLFLGLALPAVVLVAAAGLLFLTTGRTPIDQLPRAERIALPMPPVEGPEPAAQALLTPPGALTPPTAAASAAAPAAPPALFAATSGNSGALPPLSAGTPQPAPPPAPAAPAAAPVAATAPTAATAPVAASPEVAPQAAVPEAVASAAPPPAAPAPAAASPPPAPTAAASPSGVAPVVPLTPAPPAAGGSATPTFAQLPAIEGQKALATGPQSDLQQASSYGALPVVANGRQPRLAYAAPTTVDPTRPRIAVVVTGLGLWRDATMTAVNKLPSDIDLSFSPYSPGIADWVANARSRGHETLLDLPLEAPNFPATDTGPLAVMARDSPSQSISRLDTILGKAVGYVGLVATPRSPEAASASWTPLLHEIASRGLLFVGDGLSGVGTGDRPAVVTVTVAAGDPPFRAAADAQLRVGLAAAQRDGTAVVTIPARPVEFQALVAFLATLPQNGVALVPLTALVPPAPAATAAAHP